MNHDDVTAVPIDTEVHRYGALGAGWLPSFDDDDARDGAARDDGAALAARRLRRFLKATLAPPKPAPALSGEKLKLKTCERARVVLFFPLLARPVCKRDVDHRAACEEERKLRPIARDERARVVFCCSARRPSINVTSITGQPASNSNRVSSPGTSARASCSRGSRRCSAPLCRASSARTGASPGCSIVRPRSCSARPRSRLRSARSAARARPRSCASRRGAPTGARRAPTSGARPPRASVGSCSSARCTRPSARCSPRWEVGIERWRDSRQEMNVAFTTSASLSRGGCMRSEARVDR